MTVGLALAGELSPSHETNPVLDVSGVSSEPGPDAASRELMTPEEAKLADSYSDPPDVPADTKVYIAPGTADSELAEGCHRRLAEAPNDELCQLYLLHAEGKARDGAYSASESREALEQADAEKTATGGGE